MASLTGATVAYQLSITGLYNTPQQLQGFAADDVFATTPIKSIETLMGVDGVMSAGFVWVPIEQMIDLQADSDSNAIFDNWWQAQQAAEDVYFADAVIRLKALGIKWTMSRGVLSTYPPMPDVKKMIQPRKFGITWNNASPSPI